MSRQLELQMQTRGTRVSTHGCGSFTEAASREFKLYLERNFPLFAETLIATPSSNSPEHSGVVGGNHYGLLGYASSEQTALSLVSKVLKYPASSKIN